MLYPATSLVRMVRGYDAVYDLEQKSFPLVAAEQNRPEFFTMKVTTSEGQELEVQIRPHIYGCQVIDYNYDKARKNYTVQRGTCSRERIYFDLPDAVIRKSPEYKAHQQIINKAANEFYGLKQKKTEELARALLEEKHPELVDLIDKTPEQIKSWMDAEGWTYPADMDFSKFDWAGFILTSGPDGYGHACGTAAAVEFQNKKIYIHGWSSDD